MLATSQLIQTLAQSESGGFSVFAMLGVLLVLVVGLFVIVWWVRRRLSPNEDFHGEGFTLGDLRRLHKSGQLSDEEFEKAKAGMIAAAQAAAQRKEEEKKNLRDLGLR
jgi:hypothetical protein